MNIVQQVSPKNQYSLIQDDILNWAATYTGEPFHAILCDPPYHLTTITKRFGSPNAAPAKGGVYRRSSAGFMGMSWDSDENGGIAFRPETWAALSQHLHPGGFILAFASSRGWHRMACAMEDSGLIMHPSLFYAWTFLSGFPKATRIPDDRFNGHRYGLQSLKPAVEPIVIAHKPLNFELIYGIISEITFYSEVICSFLNVPDVEALMSRLHQTLKAVVGDSVHASAENWGSLENVKFAGLNSESNLASLTLQSFVAGDVLTRDALRHLVRTILTGQGESLSVRDTSTSGIMESTLLNIVSLWKDILGELLNRGSTFITSMKTHLITDLRTLSSYLSQITLAITTREELNGWSSLAPIAEALLKSHLVKLQLLSSITVTENVTFKPVETERESTVGLEPIIVAQVPYSGRPVDCITRTGAGAWNIDAGRIGTNPGIRTNGSGNNIYGDLSYTGGEEWEGSDLGRWPANLLLDEAGAELLDRQSGDVSGRPGKPENIGKSGDGEKKGLFGLGSIVQSGYQDKGGASRMFFQSTWQYEILEQLENADPLKYEPKVSTAEGNVGAEAFYWAITPKGFERVTYEEWQSLDPKKRAEGNIHPTKKPISLCKYLCELISPPDAYAPRRICIPFSGSGSEMIGAILSGKWEEITGIDSNPNYHAIAEARLAWWSQWPGWGQTDVDKILASLREDVPAEQLSLFEEVT